MKTPTILPNPLFFQILSTLPSLSPPTLTPTAFSLAVWVVTPHLMCYLLNNIMDLHKLSLDTLVPEGPWCVFYATGCQVYWDLTHIFLLVLWLDITHTNTDTHTKTHSTLRASRFTHPYKYIFTPPVMCSQQLSSLHWMDNSLISKNHFPWCLFFSTIIHL